MTPTLKRHSCSLTLQRAPANAGDARVTISTSDQDRSGDVLVAEGVITTPYERNPLVLFGHDHFALPVGKTVSLSVQPGKGIVADFVWLKNDPFADRVRNAWEQGVLNAASVGFIPKKWEPNGKEGHRFTEWELLEWSVVSVPANAAATRTLKSLRLDGPAPLARSAVVLDQLTAQLKAGRVLSSANEGRLRQASDLLNTVLAQVDEPDEAKAVAVVVNDGAVPVSDATMKSAITAFVESEVARVTGRVPDSPVLLMRQPDGKTMRMTEAELDRFLSSVLPGVISNSLARMGGRVD